MIEHYFNEVDWQAALEVSKSRYKERKRRHARSTCSSPKDVTWTKPEGGFVLVGNLPAIYLNTEQLLLITVRVAFVPECLLLS